MFAEFVLPGILLGISAALSPGPILILVLSETMRGGIRSGFSVSIAPSILDVFFVPLSILLAGAIVSFQPLIGFISLLGASFLVFLAYQNLTACKIDLHQPVRSSTSLTRAITADFFNPYLYIFWFSVALPIFAKGNLLGSILFAASLSLATFLGHFSLALLVAVARTWLLNYLHWILRILSIPLLLMAWMFIREGVHLL